MKYMKQTLLEALQNLNYKIPSDPEEILYDFYFLTIIAKHADLSRFEEIDWVVKYTADIVTEELYIHMKQALKWALSCEMRHIFDGSFSPSTSNAQKLFKKYPKFTMTYYNSLKEFRTQQSLPEFLIDISKKNDDEFAKGLAQRLRGTLYKSSKPERETAYKAIKSTQRELRLSDSDLSLIFEDFFNSGSWGGGYGGEAWRRIALGWANLLRSKNLKEKIIWIDHCYDLQHNTDTVFNKLKFYYKGGTYSWIAKALDWKRDVTDVRAFYTKVSSQLQPMVAFVAKNAYGTTIQGYKQDLATTQATTQATTSSSGHTNSFFFTYFTHDIDHAFYNMNKEIKIDFGINIKYRVRITYYLGDILKAHQGKLDEHPFMELIHDLFLYFFLISDSILFGSKDGKILSLKQGQFTAKYELDNQDLEKINAMLEKMEIYTYVSFTDSKGQPLIYVKGKGLTTSSSDSAKLSTSSQALNNDFDLFFIKSSTKDYYAFSAGAKLATDISLPSTVSITSNLAKEFKQYVGPLKKHPLFRQINKIFSKITPSGVNCLFDYENKLFIKEGDFILKSNFTSSDVKQMLKNINISSKVNIKTVDGNLINLGSLASTVGVETDISLPEEFFIQIHKENEVFYAFTMKAKKYLGISSTDSVSITKDLATVLMKYQGKPEEHPFWNVVYKLFSHVASIDSDVIFGSINGNKLCIERGLFNIGNKEEDFNWIVNIKDKIDLFMGVIFKDVYGLPVDFKGTSTTTSTVTSTSTKGVDSSKANLIVQKYALNNILKSNATPNSFSSSTGYLLNPYTLDINFLLYEETIAWLFGKDCSYQLNKFKKWNDNNVYISKALVNLANEKYSKIKWIFSLHLENVYIHYDRNKDEAIIEGLGKDFSRVHGWWKKGSAHEITFSGTWKQGDFVASRFLFGKWLMGDFITSFWISGNWDKGKINHGKVTTTSPIPKYESVEKKSGKIVELENMDSIQKALIIREGWV